MTKIRIAWVEDSLEQIDKGKEYLLKYSKEKNYDINATFYNSAEDFLLHYDFSFDIVLMFITNVSKMAAKGYEVEAPSTADVKIGEKSVGLWEWMANKEVA